MVKAKKSKEACVGATRVRNSSFFQGFFISAVFICFCLVFLPARYETNDEFGNILRLSHQGEFGPDEMSPYLSQTLWSVLSFLYRVVPDVPWYGLTIYLAIFLGLGLMISVCVRRCDGTSFLILAPACFVFSFHHAVFTSFTAACLLLELAVFLSLLEWALSCSSPAKKPRIYGMLLVGCLLLSYSLRSELFFGGIAFSFPVMLFVTKLHVRKVLPYLAILIVCIAVDTTFSHLKSTTAAEAFVRYDTLRRGFHDTVKGAFSKDRTPAALKKAGWSMEDYLLFQRWILYDDTIFNPDTLKIFLEENDPQEASSLFTVMSVRLKANYLKSKYYTLLFLSTILAITVLSINNLRRMAPREIVRAVLAVGGILGMILFFAYYRFVPRVYVPLYLYALVLSLVVVYRKAGSSENRVGGAKGTRLILVSVAVLLTLCAYGAACARVLEMRKMLAGSEKKKGYIVSCLNTVASREAENKPIVVLMDPSDSLCRESIHPLKEKSDYVDLMFMPAGTDINSPRYFRVLETLKLSSGHEFLQWTIDNDRVLYAFCATGQESLDDYTDMWLGYLNRHTVPGGKVVFQFVYDFRFASGVGLVVYKAVSSARQGMIQK